jgi:hypothetical protein
MYSLLWRPRLNLYWDPKYLLRTSTAPQHICLGGIVDDLRYPSKLVYRPPNEVVRFDETHSDTFAWSTSANKASFFRRRKYIEGLSVNAVASRDLRISNSTNVLDRAFDATTTPQALAKARLDALLEDKELYLITGYKTVANPTATRTTSRAVEVKPNATPATIGIFTGIPAGAGIHGRSTSATIEGEIVL